MAADRDSESEVFEVDVEAGKSPGSSSMQGKKICSTYHPTLSYAEWYFLMLAPKHEPFTVLRGTP